MTLNEIEIDAVGRGYESLPELAAELLQAVGAPPRLIAHHILVHDTAARLVKRLRPSLPKTIDESAVCFGAATHDIGKAIHRSELSEPGKTHEEAGRIVLLERGVPSPLARFAVTHGLPFDSDSHDMEDMLVIIADKCWKGKRVNVLEERLASDMASATNRDFFDVLLELSDVIESIADAASSRLDWQNKHPVS